MSLCPSCGREVGSHITCPFCGANLRRRLTMTLFGALAIALAIGGLGMLWYLSVNTAIPTIRIGQVQAAMNYAYVRVEGIVRRSPRFSPDSESLAFWVDDGSGQMLVAAFRSEAHALIEAGRVPSIGDRVIATGVLRVRDDVPSLTIGAIDALTLTRATASASIRDLDSIIPDDVLTGVTLRGQVRAVREPYEGFRLLTIRDATGEIDVTIDDDVEQFGSPAPQAQVGDPIEVTGVVTLFEETPQITLTRGEYIKLLDEPVAIAELKPIREIGDDEIGDWVRVQGAIAKIAPFSAGAKFTLDDAQGRGIIVLLWGDVFESLPDAADWQIGAEVTAQGRVNSFRGELEIIPELAFDASILSRAVAEAPSTLTLTRLGAITTNHIGDTVFISGTVESVDRFADGVRFRLEDDTGSILLVLLSGVYEQVENGDRMEEGVSVSALGRVRESNGTLEVIPPNGGSVRVWARPAIARVAPTPEPLSVTATPRPTPPLAVTVTSAPAPQAATTLAPSPASTSTPEPGGVTAINAINPLLIGQAVTVRGQVIAVSSFSSGFRFTLDDGSGSMPLVLFDGRYREVADRAALNLGAQVTVQAIVAEFSGNLELQPASGGEVIVERPGSSSIVKTRAINTLSGADIGALTAIVGDVLRVEGFSSGVSVFVNDGTGELRVVIFSNVLSYVPNAPSLQAGAKARVVGRIDEFRGVLELVPALGYDVTINP